MKRLDYLKRLAGTAVSFTVFGIGGLIYGLVLLPSLFLFVWNADSRRAVARRMIGRGFGAFWGMMRFFGVLDYSVEGLENIDEERRQLIVANHPTLIDVVILISLIPQANCVIKEAVRRNPFMALTVRAADYISNSQPEDLLNACADYLRTGKSLLLFPEGTRTRHNQPIEFLPGAATIAARSDADILPVVIDCDPLFLSKQLPWYYVPETRPFFTIRILEPRAASEFVSEDSDERHTRHELNDALLSLITRELDDIAFSKKPNYNM